MNGLWVSLNSCMMQKNITITKSSMLTFLDPTARLLRRRELLLGELAECQAPKTKEVLSAVQWTKRVGKVIREMNNWSVDALALLQHKHSNAVWSALSTDFEDMYTPKVYFNMLWREVQESSSPENPKSIERIQYLFDHWSLKTPVPWVKEVEPDTRSYVSLMESCFQRPEFRLACEQAPIWSSLHHPHILSELTHPQARMWWIHQRLSQKEWTISVFEPFAGQLFSLFGDRIVLLIQTRKLLLEMRIHFSFLMPTLRHGIDQGFSRLDAFDVFGCVDIPIMGCTTTHAHPSPDPKCA